MKSEFRIPNYDLHWFINFTHITNVGIEPMHVFTVTSEPCIGKWTTISYRKNVTVYSSIYYCYSIILFSGVNNNNICICLFPNFLVMVVTCRSSHFIFYMFEVLQRFWGDFEVNVTGLSS